MDTTDPEISFDQNGVCNHCHTADKKLNSIFYTDEAKRDLELKRYVEIIKESGKGKKYDCVIGLSGGVDSSYLASVVKELGLRPLAVHIDNGWNSELAVKNIENIITRLDIDLHTHVIDWEEFRDLQLSFLKASVVDLEMLSDNAIQLGVYRVARKYGVTYFVDGTNYAAESIMPGSWFYVPKYDSLNIRSIFRRFGSGRRLKTFPVASLREYILFMYLKKFNNISLLNYVPYQKKEAQKLLIDKFDWRDYGGKHYESRITKFYQAYILPQKFNIDKRKAHLSSLICSKQITREQALEELNIPLYNAEDLEVDREFFLKKLQLTETEWEQIMGAAPKPHLDFPAYYGFHLKLAKLKRKILG